jgi:hypothetical protein
MWWESNVLSLSVGYIDVVVAKRKPGSDQHHGKE